jgi:hypothetical protein
MIFTPQPPGGAEPKGGDVRSIRTDRYNELYDREKGPDEHTNCFVP